MTRLCVEFEWTTLGELGLDVVRRLRFPAAATVAGLYQLLVESADARPGVYLGETSNLRRRFAHYRSPGSTEATNLRMRAALTEALDRGARITVLVVTDARVRLEAREWEALDLARKHQRLVAEQSAIAAALLVEDLADEDNAAPVRPRLLNRPGVGEDAYALRERRPPRRSCVHRDRRTGSSDRLEP